MGKYLDENGLATHIAIERQKFATSAQGTKADNAVQYIAQTLTDAQKTQARNNIGAGTYSKPSSGIPASDLATGVIPSVPVTDVTVGGTSVVSNNVAAIPAIPSNVVQYTAQSLTDAQKAQARTNIGASALGDDILVINNDPPLVSGTIQQTNFATLFGITEQEVYLIFSGKKTKLYYENPNTGSSEGTTWYTYFVLFTQMDELSSYRGLVLEYGSRRYGYYSLAYDSSEYYDIDVVAEPVIPTISTNIVQDKTSDVKTASPKAVYDVVYTNIKTTMTAGGMLPNVMYSLGTLTGTITFSLATPSDNTIVNHYYWTFTAGSTAPTITWPVGITWAVGSAPAVTSGHYYEVSVYNGIGIFIDVEPSS